MKKNQTIFLGLLVLIILVVGGFLIFHKSPKTPTTTSNSTTSNNSPNQPASVNNDVLETETNSSVGKYLTTPSKNTLYTYGGDTSGVSNCTGSCLAIWPAYQDKGSTDGLPSNVSTIKRSDNGETQYTYKGMPLYTFASESAGQVTGDGVSNFSVAKP